MSSGTFLDSHPIPEALSERSKNGSSDLAQLLFWIRKHASLHIVRQTHWIASTGMNEANSPVNSRKVEVCLFYYPWGELDDLFCRQRFLSNKPANYRLTNAQHGCSLPHGNPTALIGRRTCRKSFGMADMLHAFLCPCIPGSSSIPQSVENRNDRAVFTNEGEFADQRRHFFGVDVVVVTGLVFAHSEFRMSTASPVQLEMHRGRIIRCVRHYFFEYSSEYALLQGDRRVRMVPQLLDIIP